MKYTEEQIKNILQIYSSIEEYEKISKYNKAIRFLNDTDYISNKIIEYQFLKKELEQDYTEILLEREKARETIRQYEEKNERFKI